MIKFSDKENEVMCNMIGACESGGQIYGNRDYGCFCEDGLRIMVLKLKN